MRFEEDLLKNYRSTLAVDFDGVLHAYTSAWKDAAHIPDLPVPGAFAWLEAMTAHFDVVIFSTRCKEIAGPAAMCAWFKKHGMAPGIIKRFSFQAEKPAALIYLDDRAWQFSGTFPTKEEIDAFKPWNKRT